MGVAPQILDPIFEITPISDHLSYKGSLSVQPSWRSCGERKKERRKKETSAVKYNISGHYRGRRYNKETNASRTYSPYRVPRKKLWKAMEKAE